MGSDAVEPLILELGNKDPHVRRNAVSALGEIRDLRAVEPLIRLLNHKAKEVKVDAMNALIEIGRRAGGEVVKPLIERLSDDKICNSIAFILGKIGDRRP
jgi:HEAT repeat protein